MSIFVSYPNLPNETDVVLVGEKYYNILSIGLKDAGISALKVPENPFVDKRLASHADLSVFYAGKGKIFLADYLKNTEFTDSLMAMGTEIFFPSEIQRAEYPNDCQFNICAIKNRFVYSQNVSSNAIVDYLTNDNLYKGINIRQGYAKCSICVVDDNSVISSDRGAANALKQNGFDVLEIEPGYIDLDGFPYGFIGGATFKIKNNLMAFTGSLKTHPDKKRIISFLKERGIEILYLSDLNIFDIGSAIPILEK